MISSNKTIIPLGVHGTKLLCPKNNLATFSGWKPSTSFDGSMASKTLSSLIWSGKGNCTKIPSTVSSSFNCLISFKSSSSLKVASCVIFKESIPT